MKNVEDIRTIARLEKGQMGVFSRTDLESAFAERHPNELARRVRALESVGGLRRFMRGWYVTDGFDLATLSQRIAPDSYVSFGNALARTLAIGTSPERQIMAAKVGKSRRYRALGFEIVHLGVQPHLLFGYGQYDGVRYADPEKALLDTLYFHTRGQTYVFDVYSDIRLTGMSMLRIREYLQHYRNERFVAFVSRYLKEGTS